LGDPLSSGEDLMHLLVKGAIKDKGELIMKKRVLALWLAIMMIASIFSGCAKKLKTVIRHQVSLKKQFSEWEWNVVMRLLTGRKKMIPMVLYPLWIHRIMPTVTMLQLQNAFAKPMTGH
jgi:hypothetical protein